MPKSPNLTSFRKQRPPSLYRQVTVGIILLSVLSFTVYMGVIAFIRSSKKLEDLRYVSGQVADIKMIKHKREGKFKTTLEDVMVLRIEGAEEKFGFLQSGDAFRKLLGFNKAGKTIQIYYDPEGQRIEDNVTLHTFDMTIGQAKIIDIKETNKTDRLGAIFFFVLSLFLVVLMGFSLRKSRKEKEVAHDEQ